MTAGSAARSAGAGLCDSCRHQQMVRNTRGSVFSLCRRSQDRTRPLPALPAAPVNAAPATSGASYWGGSGSRTMRLLPSWAC